MNTETPATRSRSKNARTPATTISPLAVDYDETGRLLGGLCRRTVEYLVARGELRALKVGSRRLVRVAEIERYLAERETEAA